MKHSLALRDCRGSSEVATVHPSSGVGKARVNEENGQKVRAYVKNNANREQETSCRCGNTTERAGHRATTGQEHGRNQDVCHQTKCQEDNVRDDSVSSLDDFEESMRIWSSTLEPESLSGS